MCQVISYKIGAVLQYTMHIFILPDVTAFEFSKRLDDDMSELRITLVSYFCSITQQGKNIS